MSEATLTSGVSARACAILERSGIMANPYFRALQGGAMPLDAFRRTQEQFFFAVTFFPRPMAALVGRIPDPKQRLDVLHNLVEEHGEFQEQRFHHNTFQQFLRSIGADPDRLDDLMIWPEVRAFNSVLTTACVLDDLEVGVACMGVIEQAFAGISAIIGRAVVERGWVKAEDLVHYKLHAEIDERHAEEFFAVVETGWRDGSRRYLVEQGLELGTYIFDRLYRDLHTAGSSRIPQYHSAPHETRGDGAVLSCG
jgi:pyrroloquinoline-quinone synthase